MTCITHLLCWLCTTSLKRVAWISLHTSRLCSPPFSMNDVTSKMDSWRRAKLWRLCRRRVMNRFEQKRMTLFQRITFALLFLVCILLVVVLLPVNEGETARIFIGRSKAFFSPRYNTTYPLTKPTSELLCVHQWILVSDSFFVQACWFSGSFFG